MEPLGEQNLEEILRRIRRIEISTRRMVDDVFSGAYHSVFRGQGIEFDEVREYQPGDDIRFIDWNVTARMNAPYVKRFMEERELVVMFLLDVSASSRFGTTIRTRQETAAEICATLAFSAIQNHDKVGAVVFTDRVEKYIPPEKGRRHALHVLREILVHRPEGPGTDVGEALSFVSRVVRRRAIVFVLSDFESPPFDRPLSTAARKFDLVAVDIVDPRERELVPGGMVRVWDQERREEVVLDLSRRDAARRFAERVRRRDEELDALFARNGVDRVRVETGEDVAVPLSRFFRARARRR